MRMRPRRSQSGFTLLEVLLAIGISLTIGAVALTEMRRDNESKQARAVGQQLAAVGNALNTYMALHYTDIVNLTDQPGPGPGTADDPAPRYCTANVATIDGNPVSLCTVTTDTLVRSGTLPRNFSGRNAFGAEYDLYIRVIGDATNPIVDGLAMVNQPYTTGGSVPRYDLMGQAMQEAGADSAMTRTIANSMEGLNGTWRDDVWPGITHGGRVFTGVNRLGLLGYRVGYGSSAYAAFLRRDGTLEMTGHLNMDSHNIDNVGGLDAQFVRISQPPAGGANPGEGLALNSETGNEPTRTAFVASDGGLAIRNRDGVSIQDLAGDPGSFAAGRITGVGDMFINGDITATRNIQAQDIRGRSAQLTGSMIVDVGLQVGATTAPATQRVTIQNGNIVAGGNVTGATAQFNQVNAGTGANQYSLTNAGLVRGGSPTSLWWYETTEARWRTQSGIRADTEVSALTLRADNNIVAGGVLEVAGTYTGGGGSVVTVGQTCSLGTAAGKIRRANTGELTQCVVDGTGTTRWSVMGVRTVPAPNVLVTAVLGVPQVGFSQCPPGTKLIGGGVRRGAYVPGNPAGGRDSGSPAASYPDHSNNRWYVETAPDNGTGTSFYAQALCAY